MGHSYSDTKLRSDYLLRARTTDHLHIGNGHVSVFRVALLYAGVLGGILRVFLEIVHLCVGYDASHRNGMSYVIRQRHLIALQLPGAAVICLQVKLVGTIA